MGEDGEPDQGDVESSSPTTDVLDKPRWVNVVRGPEMSSEEPVQGGSLVVALETEASSYLPSAAIAGQAAFNVAFGIFDPLVTRDASGEIRPYLAESVEPNDDFTEWTLRLRPGVRFHDGTPLNAEALKRIWDEYLTTGPVTQSITSFVERMEVVDGLTVRYVMTEPHAAFPELLELQIGWPFSPEAAQRLGDEFGDRPVGTGPFRFVRWQRDGEFVMERNPDYWQEDQPYLDRVTFRTIPDETTRAAALASGEVDAVVSRQLSGLVADVADMDGVMVVLGPDETGGAGLQFNTAVAPTDDVRVRRALAHAVDQEALLEVAAGEAAELTEVLTQFFPSGSPFHSEVVADAAPDHDPQRAMELYNEYVEDPDRSDGKPVGASVSVTLDTASRPASVELAEAYKGFYEKIGFDVTVNPVEQTELIVRAVSDEFQLQIRRQGRNGSPLGEFLFHYDAEVASNFSNFHDDVVAGLLDELRTTGDVEEQARLAEEMGLHLADQVPWQWLAGDLPFIAAKDEVEGLRSWVFPDGTLGSGAGSGTTLWGQVWISGA